MARDAQNRNLIAILEGQVQAQLGVAGHALAVTATVAANPAPGPEIGDLRERLRVAEDDLRISSARLASLQSIIKELQERAKGRLAQQEQDQEQIVLLQAELQESQEEYEKLLLGYYGARVAAGLPTDPPPKGPPKEEGQ